MISLWKISILALCLGPAITIQAADAPTNEDLRHVRSLSAPQLSPDGGRILLQITDATADGGKDHLWLIDIKSDSARQLTWSRPEETRGEFAAKWTPDGTAILFLAKRGDHVQLHRLPMNGGEAHAYDLKIAPLIDQSLDADAVPPGKTIDQPPKDEKLSLDIEGFAIAPNGKTIAVLARDPETAGEKKQKKDKADQLWLDHDRHGERLYLLAANSDQLTAVAIPPDVKRIAWSPKGEQLLAVTEAPNGQSDLGPANGAWIASTADPAHPQAIKQLPASLAMASWSADGAQIYFLAQSVEDAPPGYQDLFVFNSADRSVQALSQGLIGSVIDSPPLASGTSVLQAAQFGTEEGVMRFDGKKRERISFDLPVVRHLSSNATQTGFVWVGESAGQPESLYFAAKPGRGATRLSTPDLLPAAWPMLSARRVAWRNEGMTVEGLLYLPAIPPGAKVPLIVSVHGGPTGVWRDGFHPLNNFLVGQGWAVFEPNPRGSTGSGAAFAAANHNDLGGGDFRDIMTGVDLLLSQFPIDPARLALIGYSYGGEMAGFAEGKTNRFKAIVSSAPVIDQQSEYGTEDSSWYDRWFYGKPWEHVEDAWRQSPLAYVAGASTPFLLLQGEADKTDPLGQSLEMYRALRQAGVRVELVQFPREDHGPLARGINGVPTNEPWHGFVARQKIVTFIEEAFTAR